MSAADISILQQIIDKSKKIVFFGGAGVSTESGIPDFRSVDGLYNQQWKYPPEQIISRTFFYANTPEFYRFYRAKLLPQGIKPNAAHYKLAELEAAGKLLAVVTQNIDGLHQLAGSKTVWELHGSTLRNYCTKCHEFYDFTAIKNKVEEASKKYEKGDENYAVPKCDKCGGIIKPDVVLYEEGLDGYTMQKSVQYIQNADVLIIGGTSLAVYPAAGLIDYYRGNKLVLINLQHTPRDRDANLCIAGKIGEVFSQI